MTVNGIDVEEAGEYTLTIDYTVSGTRSFWVSVNGASGVEVPVSGTSWDNPTSDTVTVNLAAGQNSIKFYNDTAHGPDLDRIGIVAPGSR